jgi:hypothetical protein
VIPRNVQITLILLLCAVFGSGIYILRLDRRTKDNLLRASDRRPIAPQVAGNSVPIKLTVAYDDDGVFRSRDASAVLPADPSTRAREILDTLITQYVEKPSPHPLAEGSAVNNVFLVRGKLAVVDLNQALADGHRSGIMVGDFTVMSLIDTLSANFPEVEQVKILIDGKERETLAGHADLKSIYSTAAVHKIVGQLE